MTKNELKELVKQHFNLVEANVEKFDKAELEDGSKVSNEEAGKFAVGQTLFIEDKDGNMVKAPEGEHVSSSGIQFILDKDSKITGLKYPDAKGEGDADLAEEDKNDVVIEKKGEKADEGAFDARTDAEEEGYLDGEKDEKAKLKEDDESGEIKLEEVVELIGEVVEAKVEEMKEEIKVKMAVIEEEMKSMKDKMTAFSNEPAAEKTIPNVKFAKEESNTKADKRYNLMLKRMSKK